MSKLPINWFDIALVVTLLVGLKIGQKQGLSQQLLPSIKWLAIVFTCAFLYEPLGDLLHDSASGLGLLFSYIAAYVGVIIVVNILFSFLKRAAGGKLTGSDVFGKSEYYLGMPAGMVEFACITITALALLNARFISEQEVKANRAFQKEVYSNELFPGLHTLQDEVFKDSLTGSWIKNNLGFMLIKPTPPAPPIQRKEFEMK